VRDDLRGRLGADRRAGLAGDTDTEVLFGLVLDALDAGADPADAQARAVAAGAAAASDDRSRLNLLLADGEAVWATAWGNSLVWRHDPAAGEAVVASEPFDDDPAWQDVPDRSLVVAGPAGVVVHPLG
jgi:glutamine amidotransferase